MPSDISALLETKTEVHVVLRFVANGDIKSLLSKTQVSICGYFAFIVMLDPVLNFLP